MTGSGAELDAEYVRALVRTALDEDLAQGPDVTTRATVGQAPLDAAMHTRGDGVLAGLEFVREVFDQVLGADYEWVRDRSDGDAVTAGDRVLRVRAPGAGLLTAERTALNLLCHLSGVASATAEWVRVVAGTGCRVRDSRKTLPGLRAAQKYAVRCGGGVNHRMALGDALLVKDNHISAAGSVGAAIGACRRSAPDLPLEVEVSTLEELAESLEAGPDLVLLDNFTPAGCAAAVRRVRSSGRQVRLEASGTLTLQRARAYADTGVDYLAVGRLTHSAPALDVGLDM